MSRDRTWVWGPCGRATPQGSVHDCRAWRKEVQATDGVRTSEDRTLV
eukprot:CAMPEP_0198545638 /NCGR_PEP_ID=MMETSP1462-20131121/64741_1 /TAXON_ID=1333877 /ORGANISM="Brandtodinium nutriculum, Strain RCC3387" /LENGTH=46 /DNA_ID= /DNA_START= /DNA_END= /DNA_ORIENTATION=